jgi:hypothetical protein
LATVLARIEATAASASRTSCERPTKTTVQRFAAIFRPYGITFDGEHIWIQSLEGVEGLGKLSLSGQLLATYRDPNLKDIAFDGTHIWIATGSNYSVIKLDKEGTLLGELSPSSGPASTIIFDGESIWATNSGLSVVTKFDLDGKELLAVALEGPSAGSIAFDGENIWVAVSEHEAQVTKLTKLSQREDILFTVTVTNSSRYNRVTLLSDGSHLWVTGRRNGLMGLTKVLPNGTVDGFYPMIAVPVAFDGQNLWVADDNLM